MATRAGSGAGGGGGGGGGGRSRVGAKQPAEGAPAGADRPFHELTHEARLAAESTRISRVQELVHALLSADNMRDLAFGITSSRSDNTVLYFVRSERDADGDLTDAWIEPLWFKAEPADAAAEREAGNPELLAPLNDVEAKIYGAALDLDEWRVTMRVPAFDADQVIRLTAEEDGSWVFVTAFGGQDVNLDWAYAWVVGTPPMVMLDCLVLHGTHADATAAEGEGGSFRKELASKIKSFTDLMQVLGSA